jgi:flagellar biosynthesis protein FliQ
MTRVTGIEYDPNVKPPLILNWRFCLYALVFSALIIAVIIGVIVAIVFKSLSLSAPTGLTFAPTTIAKARYLKLFLQAVKNDLMYQP